jgi:quinol monooxygenase YgiN
MELFIFARFHASEGQEEGIAAALREVVGPTRQEQGCLAIAAYRSTQDPSLFYIHSHWVDESTRTGSMKRRFRRTPACPTRCASSNG